jgi:hypothetical protein
MDYNSRLEKFYQEQSVEVKAPSMEQFQALDALAAYNKVMAEKKEFTEEEVGKFFAGNLDPKDDEWHLIKFILRTLWEARV